MMKQRGFTIIETLVAIAILMIAIVGPLTIANKGLVAAVSARNQFTANFLAQDALEYIKNRRDTNLLTKEAGGSVEWLDDIYDGSLNCDDNAPHKKCTIDTVSGTTNACNDSDACDKLYYNSSGRLTHVSSGNQPSPFSRYYKVVLKDAEVGSGTTLDDARVEVVVTWTMGSVKNKISVKNNMFNALRY